MCDMRSFWQNESGAVTVDWVVLTAAIVGIGVAVTVQISGGVLNKTGGLLSMLMGVHVNGGNGGSASGSTGAGNATLP